MSGIYVARIGTQDGETRALVFKLLDGEMPRPTAQAFADDFEVPLIEVMEIEVFLGDELYELVTV